jgi:N utilization substance protein B
MRENLQKKSKSGLRGLTRLYAIQIMYKSEFEHKSLEKVIEEAKKNPRILISEEVSLNEIDSEFFTELITKTKEHGEEIDKLIEKNVAKNWSFDRFDKVMQSLLRLGVCELIFFDQIPANVIFNEYIEIAKSFFKKREVGFVNGILNSIFHQQKSA